MSENRSIFYILKENADGEITVDRSINTALISIFKGGVLFSQTIFNNHDGTYYFIPSGSGLYSVYYNGTVQDEFRDIYIADETDQLVKSSVDNVTIQMSAQGKVEVINGQSLLRETDVVDDLTSNSSIYPLSANQGYILSASVASKEPKDATILKRSDIVDDLVNLTTGTYKVVSADAMKIDFAGTNYLPAYTSYNSALRELDRRIYNLKTGGSYINYIPFGYKTAIASLGSAKYAVGVDGVTTGSLVTIRPGAITGLSMRFTVSGFTIIDTIHPGEDANGFRATVYLNDDATTVVGTKNFSGNSTYIYQSLFPSIPFNAGDEIKVLLSPTGSIDDTWDATDISVFVEINL